MQPDLGGSKLAVAAVSVLGRALEIDGGDMPPAGARFILNLGVREPDRLRMLELLASRQEGTINATEAEELEAYIQANRMLSILRAKALVALKNAGQEP
jgi:hypothetical protein